MADNVLWSADNLFYSIGRQKLFDHSSFSIAENERLALVGRNGCGKSTLLRVVAGIEEPAEGEIFVRKDLRIATMPQDFEAESPEKTGRQVVREGLAFFETLLRRYDTVSLNSPEHAALEQLLNVHEAWTPENKLDALIGRIALADPDKPFASMSGGERRRVVLARTILSEPDLLLLDEPTNHLDVETVAWLEDFLSSYRGACFFITHDRYFLDRIATRILELDNGKFYSCGGCYADFLDMKADREYAEDLEAAKRNAFLRREVEWVRRSPTARLKKNLGRVKRYEDLAAVAAPERTGTMELILPDPPRLGNRIVDLKNISFSRGGKKLFSGFSHEFSASEKVGIIGPNGAGKTSLLKIITGELAPDAGTVEIADTVCFNYVDQARLALNPDATLWEEVGGDSDYVDLGSAKITVRAYLRRFLFEDDRINSQVRYLSGGEKARLMLAKILKHGGNFLILDEPTNDLDLPSLRMLEEALADYPAPVIVVSHDRYFLNRVCNRIIAFEPGSETPYTTVGDFDYYLEKKKERDSANSISQPAQPKMKTPIAPAPVKAKTKKLSWAESKELDGMEEAISGAETHVSMLEEQFLAPDFYPKHAQDAPRLTKELEDAKAEVRRLYARWEELELKKESVS